MTTNNRTTQHPFDLLEAFALDALEPEEELAVEAHLEGCRVCATLVGDSLRVTAAIADSVPASSPSPELRRRLLDSVDSAGTERSQPSQTSVSPRVQVSQRRPPRSWSRVSRVLSTRWTRVLAPAIAVLALVAIGISTALNLQMSDQMGAVKSENTVLRRQLDQSMATTTALASASNTVSQMQGNLQRWQETSYALAQPGNQTLVLSPADPGVDSRGVLVLSEDGREAVLMASDLEAPQPDSVYHVWLTRGGQWYWAGEMDVDERGWGTMPMKSRDSLLQYDSVQISHGAGAAAAMASPAGSSERAEAAAGMVGDLVLVATLP